VTVPAAEAARTRKGTGAGSHRREYAIEARLPRMLRAQINVENVFDRRYFITSHSNNNISPGSPRAPRVSLTAGL